MIHGGGEHGGGVVRALAFTRGPLDLNNRAKKKKNISSEKRRKLLKDEHRKNLILHAMEDETFQLPADMDKKDEKDKKLTRMQKLKIDVQDFAVKSKCGFYVDLFQILVSFISTIVYIFETVLLQTSNVFPLYIMVLELFFALMFGFDFLLHWFISESRVQHIFTFDAMIDVLSFIPIFGILDETSEVRGVLFFRVFRIHRVFRILRLVGKSSRAVDADMTQSKVRQQLYLVIFLVYNFFFIGAGLLHALENAVPGSFLRPSTSETCDPEQLIMLNKWQWQEECHFTYFDSFYFLATTVSTIGYGDIHPATMVGRILTFALMIGLTVTLPPEVSIWQDMQAMASNYSGNFENQSRNKHVIVCGDIGTNAALRFLKEFFHQDHGDVNDSVVFLCHYEPDSTLATALADHYYESRVDYIKGSVLVESDLKRCQFMNASAVFVLSNQFSDDPVASDACSILAIKAMKDIRPTKLPIYVQLLSVESKNHRGWAHWDYLICMEEFEAAILARNVVCPGFSTMITNLMKSSGEWEYAEKDVSAWMKEYLYGFGQEIYNVSFSSYFLNMPFEVASTELFREFGVCLFAVSVPKSRSGKSPDPKSRKKKKKKSREEERVTLVNPIGYYIRSGDQAFVIADDFEDAEIVNFWNGQKQMDESPENDRMLESLMSRKVQSAVQLSPAKLFQKENRSEIASRLKAMSTAASMSPLRQNMPQPTSYSKMEEISLHDDPEDMERDIEGKEGVHDSTGINTSFSNAQSSPKVKGEIKKKVFHELHLHGKVPEDLKQHCIVVGSMSGIRGFLAVLRFFSEIPVLLLDDSPGEGTVIEKAMQEYHNVYFLRGNGLSTQVLIDAGVERAHCVVVRTNPLNSEQTQGTGRVGASIRDTATIFTSCIIEEEFNCRVIAEMLDEQSMAFLKHRPSSDNPASAWPQYCSGQVYVCDMDSVLCQIYYNKTVMELLTRLIYSTDLDGILHPGHNSVKQLNFRENDALIQIKVPKVFDKKQYHVFYSYLVIQLRLLPLAVYRSPFKHTAPLPYIVTNPPPEMEMSRHDRVFVLCDPRSCTTNMQSFSK